MFAKCFFRVFENHVPYTVFLLGLYLTSGYCGIVGNYARGKEQVKELSISGVIASLIIIMNIVTLLVLKWGLIGYFISNIFGVLIQCVYLTLKTKNFAKIHLFRKNDELLQYQMKSFSKPLILNATAWWINSVSDRYIVTILCGFAVNGIYSIAYKIPTIITVFQQIFGQAWTIQAVKSVDSRENMSYSEIYKIYNILMLLITSILILLNKALAFVLYSNDFFIAWEFVPMLLLSSYFAALSAYAGGIFTAFKESKIVMQTTFVGAGINIFLNIVLIYYIGAIGAAISTAISYFVIWIVRFHRIKKMVTINHNFKNDLMGYSLIIIQACMYLVCKNDVLLYSSQLILIFLMFSIHCKELLGYASLIKDKFNS